MIVDIACLYTSCECPSRRSSTQKLSNQVTSPCSLTPFTRKIVSGVLFLRTWLRKVSCRFCERSAAIVAVPFFSHAGPFPASLIARPPCSFFSLAYPDGARTPPLQGTSAGSASTSWGQRVPGRSIFGANGPPLIGNGEPACG